MEDKLTTKIKLKQIGLKKSGCKQHPCVSLYGEELTKAGFQAGEKVLIESEPNRIVIRRTLDKQKVFILRQMTEQNPDIQNLIDRFNLVLL